MADQESLPLMDFQSYTTAHFLERSRNMPKNTSNRLIRYGICLDVLAANGSVVGYLRIAPEELARLLDFGKDFSTQIRQLNRLSLTITCSSSDADGTVTSIGSSVSETTSERPTVVQGRQPNALKIWEG